MVPSYLELTLGGPRMTGVALLTVLLICGSSCLPSPAPLSKPWAKCLADHDCAEGYYCYRRSNWCAKCTNCTLYFRRFSELRCSKDPVSCGPCIDGYEEETFEGGGVRDTCLKRTAEEEDLLEEMLPSQITYKVGGIFFGTVLVVCLIINSAMLLRSSRNADQPEPQEPCRHLLPSAPPPPSYFRAFQYSEPTQQGYTNIQFAQDPLAPQYGVVREDPIKFLEAKEESSLNQAQKFREAYLYDAEESLPERTQPEPVSLHEEETMESTWTPHADSQPLVTNEAEQSLDRRRFRRAFSEGAYDLHHSRRCSRCPPSPDHRPEPKRLRSRSPVRVDASSSSESEEDCVGDEGPTNSSPDED